MTTIPILVHVQVAKAFIPNPNSLPQVNHKNGIRHDNRVDNLEWCTAAQNLEHSRMVLGHTSRHEFPDRKKAIIAFNGEKILHFDGLRKCARELGLPYQGIQNIIKKKAHTYFGWTFFRPEIMIDSAEWPLILEKIRKIVPFIAANELRKIPEVLRPFIKDLL